MCHRVVSSLLRTFQVFADAIILSFVSSKVVLCFNWEGNWPFKNKYLAIVMKLSTNTRGRCKAAVLTACGSHLGKLTVVQFVKANDVMCRQDF